MWGTMECYGLVRNLTSKKVTPWTCMMTSRSLSYMSPTIIEECFVFDCHQLCFLQDLFDLSLANLWQMTNFFRMRSFFFSLIFTSYSWALFAYDFFLNFVNYLLLFLLRVLFTCALNCLVPLMDGFCPWFLYTRWFFFLNYLQRISS
jgi:hypothetical protein